jgi:hypothetical protein
MLFTFRPRNVRDGPIRSKCAGKVVPLFHVEQWLLERRSECKGDTDYMLGTAFAPLGKSKVFHVEQSQAGVVAEECSTWNNGGVRSSCWRALVANVRRGTIAEWGVAEECSNVEQKRRRDALRAL